MVGENRIGAFHQRPDLRLARARWQVGPHRLPHDVVRGMRVEIFRTIGIDHDMAIADARVEVDVFRFQHLPHRLDHRLPLCGADVAGAVVDEYVPVACDRVASPGDVVGSHGDVHARGLQRRPSGVVDGAVVAEDLEVAHVASRGPARWDHLHETTTTLCREAVHVRRARRLHGRATIELGERVIGRAVGHQDQVFHATLGSGSIARWLPCGSGALRRRREPVCRWPSPPAASTVPSPRA